MSILVLLCVGFILVMGVFLLIALILQGKRR